MSEPRHLAALVNGSLWPFRTTVMFPINNRGDRAAGDPWRYDRGRP